MELGVPLPLPPEVGHRAGRQGPGSLWQDLAQPLRRLTSPPPAARRLGARRAGGGLRSELSLLSLLLPMPTRVRDTLTVTSGDVPPVTWSSLSQAEVTLQINLDASLRSFIS